MSPRAAWRLASLGYDRVFDHVAGKADWLGYGLPWEGTAQLIGPQVVDDVVTCRTDEPLAAVRARVSASQQDLVVVVNDAHVVLGRLRLGSVGEADATVTAGQVMTEGPTTVRPSEEVDPLLGRMRKANVDRVLVTRPDGRFLGIFVDDPASAASSTGQGG